MSVKLQVGHALPLEQRDLELGAVAAFVGNEHLRLGRRGKAGDADRRQRQANGLPHARLRDGHAALRDAPVFPDRQRQDNAGA